MRQMIWLLLVDLLQSSRGTFPRVGGWGGLERASWWRKRREGRRLPTTGCSVRPGNTEWGPERGDRGHIKVGSSPLVKGLLVSKVNQVSLLEGSGHLEVRALWLGIWGPGGVGT